MFHPARSGREEEDRWLRFRILGREVSLKTRNCFSKKTSPPLETSFILFQPRLLRYLLLPNRLLARTFAFVLQSLILDHLGIELVPKAQ